MFERFTAAARSVVHSALHEAEQEPSREITAEHLAIALVRGQGADSLAARIFDEYELPRAEMVDAIRATRRRAGLSDADTEALRELGIDVDAVVERVGVTHTDVRARIAKAS